MFLVGDIQRDKQYNYDNEQFNDDQFEDSDLDESFLESLSKNVEKEQENNNRNENQQVEKRDVIQFTNKKIENSIQNGKTQIPYKQESFILDRICKLFRFKDFSF